MRNIVVIAGTALVAGLGIGYATGHDRDAEIPPPQRVAYRFHAAKTIPPMLLIETLQRRVASIKPPPALDLAELASAYLERGRATGDESWLDKAEAAAKQSLAALSSPNPSRYVLAKLAAERHEFRRSIELTQEALKDRSSPGGLSLLITAYLALGELASASEVADDLVDALPVSGSFLQRALVLEALGRDREAASDFENAASREEAGSVDEAAKLRALWGRFYLRQGRLGDARKLAREARRLSPTNALALALDGELSLREGRPNESAARFIEAFGVARQPRYLMLFGRAKAAAGDARAAEDARTQAERLLRKDLGTGRYGHRLDLVELLLDRARPAELAEAVRLAEEEMQVRKSADALFALARARELAGRHDDAIRAMRAALRTGARRQELYAWASRIERSRNRFPQAELYEKLGKRTATGPGVGFDDRQ